VLTDGNGGLWVIGEYDAANHGYGFIQHMGGNGVPAVGWNSDGAALTGLPGQGISRLASDGVGGAIAVWENSNRGVYANHYPGDFPTATLLSLASADAFADRVRLLWQGEGALSVSATLERRTEPTSWQTIGAPSAEGSDRLVYDDRDVTPGTRYAYRLRYTSDGTEHTTPEAWVTVPVAVQFTLAGLRPNPSSGSNLRVSFSLPNAGPARLELIDIAGRRIAARDVGQLGAGEHVEPLQTDSHVPAGLYWLRLTQGNRSLVTRAVVTG
jgi:hypothetical protein